jgi:RNA polymerase sigma-54 factor
MISQQQTQRQQLKILPQQIQLLNLFFLNTIELEQRIKNELEENPLLENNTSDDDAALGEKPSKDAVQDFQDWEEHGYDDAPDYKSEYSNYFNDENMPAIPIVSMLHFKDEAKQQLSLLTLDDEQRQDAEYIIDILNHKGLMDRPFDEVADDMSFHFQELVETDRVEKALRVVQTLDPIGLGACSVQECILIQLQKMNTQRPDVKVAITLIKNHYNDLLHRQFEKIHHVLNVDEEELRIVLNLIGSIKFYPVTETSAFDPKNTIMPDFIISRHGEMIQVDLYKSRSASVFVNQSLHDQLLQQVSKQDKGASQYIKSKMQSAQWFVNAVKQREDTMMRIVQCIVRMQYDYFIDGDIRLLKPMVLRNISDETGMDISTISRITSNKYAETHFGLVYLKDLFSEGIADKKGEVISNKVIQSVIQDAIQGENKQKPYTDQQLAVILSSQGYNVARRTVAKYREQLQIPIAQIRAVWA